MSRDWAASVRARLLNLAKAEGSDFNQVLVRFALERFLYRLSISGSADCFLLKGAMLFSLWYDMPHRPTRDIDLLGFVPGDLITIKQLFCQIADIKVDDGVVFDSGTIAVSEIRKEAAYSGARVIVCGELARARFRTQIDIGFGDAVTPDPVEAVFPLLLPDFPAPRLKTYPVYTVIAEKLHAIVLLGMSNSRLKDYLDLSVIFAREKLNQAILAQAIVATFNRRGMALPNELPLGLSDEFANDVSRQAIWRAFLRKNELPLEALQGVVARLRANLLPVLELAAMVPIHSLPILAVLSD